MIAGWSPNHILKDEDEWIFQRFYDFEPDGLLTFNMVTFNERSPGVVTTSSHLPFAPL